MSMTDRAVRGSEVFSLALELADSGSFVSGDEVVRAVRSLALDTRLLGDQDAVAVLDQRCMAALRYMLP